MRLIIHPGFGKCGSSAIQTALAANQAQLKRQSVYLFGRNLSIQYSAPPADAPLWVVAHVFRDKEQRKTVAARLRSELAHLRSVAPNATAILSAEVLGQPGQAIGFEGIDDLCDTMLVFYIRPQFEWIPSAWKQWGLKSGTALEEFTEHCLRRGSPGFLRTIARWSATLPKARVVVRVLAQAIAERGDPATDFFNIVGLGGDRRIISDTRVNPSPDFALLHVLNSNPWLFQSEKDNEPFKALMRMLPERHLRTNIRMLRREDEERLAGRFMTENKTILNKYCGLSTPAADQAYETYFLPRGLGNAYSDVGEIDKINRAVGILLETMLSRFGRKPIVRRPYWKIPRRILARLRGVR